MTTITDTIKQMVDELELERHLGEVTQTAEQAARQALEKAGDFAHAHTTDLEQLLDRAGSAIDDRTEGRYADTWAKVKDQVTLVWSKLADQRSSGTQTADEVAGELDDPAE
jgi:gas vesicle protein